MTCLRGQLSQRSPELARAEAEAITAASGHIAILTALNARGEEGHLDPNA